MSAEKVSLLDTPIPYLIVLLLLILVSYWGSRIYFTYTVDDGLRLPTHYNINYTEGTMKT